MKGGFFLSFFDFFLAVYNREPNAAERGRINNRIKSSYSDYFKSKFLSRNCEMSFFNNLVIGIEAFVEGLKIVGRVLQAGLHDIAGAKVDDQQKLLDDLKREHGKTEKE